MLRTMGLAMFLASGLLLTLAILGSPGSRLDVPTSIFERQAAYLAGQ
jgi:hypothetical protein